MFVDSPAIYEVKERFRPIKCKLTGDVAFAVCPRIARRSFILSESARCQRARERLYRRQTIDRLEGISASAHLTRCNYYYSANPTVMSGEPPDII